MTRKILALAAMMAGLVGILFTGLGSGTGSATHLGVAHPSDPQVFLIDNLVCRGGTSLLDGSEDATTFPTAGVDCSGGGGEDLSTSASVSQHQDTVIHKGNRLSLGANWSDTAFGIGADAAIADGTEVGDVLSAINIACDDTIDFFVDNTSTLPLEGGFADAGTVPEQFNEQTTAWGPGTGFAGSDESFLDNLLPAQFTKHARYRADINFVTLGDSFPVPLAVPVSLNAVILEPTFGSSRVSITLLGGDANAPSSQLVLCLDSPQTSIANITTAALGTNPAVAGLYAGWTSYVSAAGIRDESIEHVGYVTNCKQIGGAVTDADNDCWDDADDTAPGDPDQDSDGLLDGVDLTYAGLACVTDADCDNDGRTDAEEMLQTSVGLTDPTVADTDGDGFLDSGLNIDCDGNGVPDSVTEMTDAGAGTGRNRVLIAVQYCNQVSGKGGRPVGNPGAASEDNCPTVSNASQLNSSTVDVGLDALPVPGDTNGRFNSAADLTHADASPTGDACSGDDDADGIPDLVENEDAGTMFYDSTGGAGANFCNLDGAGVAADTDGLNRDSDGDGSIDGVECQLAKNPADATSKPGTTMTPEQQIFYRLIQMTRPGMTFLNDLDDGSTVNGVAEAKGLGAGAAASFDNDRDGCADEVEFVDVDGTRSVAVGDTLAIARASLGIAPFTGGLTAEEKRTGDIDFNGAIAISDRLGAARIQLSGALASVPDYQLLCKAANIGYDAN